MLKISDCFNKYKNILFAIGDPAGAKAILALVNLNKNKINNFSIISDKFYNFHEDFDLHIDYIEDLSDLNISFFDLVLVGTSIPTGIELMVIKAAKEASVANIAFVDSNINFKRRFFQDESFHYPNEIFVTDFITKKKH